MLSSCEPPSSLNPWENHILILPSREVINLPGQTVNIRPTHVIHILKDMHLNFKKKYCGLLLLHPVMRHIFANTLQPLSIPILERRLPETKNV